MLFVGISTGGSSIHQAFPRWAGLLCPGTRLSGVDLAEDSPPDAYRRLVTTLRDNPYLRGAVVTSHKLRLHRSCGDLLDCADPLVELMREVNSLDTRGDRVTAFARDPEALTLVLDDVLGTPDRPVVCLGDGGAATALVVALLLDVGATLQHASPVPRPSDRRPALTVVGRTEHALRALDQVRGRCGAPESVVELVLSRGAEHAAAVVRSSRRAVVVNATGLGKTEAASPLPSPDAFAPDAVAWDFNYRGPLTFLEQARQAGIRAVDGWDYFVAGWTTTLAAITGTALTAELVAQARATVATPS